MNQVGQLPCLHVVIGLHGFENPGGRGVCVTWYEGREKKMREEGEEEEEGTE